MTQTTVSAWQGRVDEIARALAATARERDIAGGTAKYERDLLRQSDLLTLSIPTSLGGIGADWTSVLSVVRCLARVDSALAHLFGFHHLQLATTQLFGTPTQWASWFEQTVEQRWFWGNALNPLDKGTAATFVEGNAATRDAPHYFFSGIKRFCSGATDSDRLLASAFDDDGRLLIAVLPTMRKGITVQGDWDNIGQRQTDSGSVVFDKVEVLSHELLLEPGPLSTPFATLRPILAQLILANIYLGIGEGALEEARDFTRSRQRPWVTSNVTRWTQDPYVLTHFGDFHVGLLGTRALADQAANAFDLAWTKGASLNETERGATAIAVAAAKVSATRAGLDVASRIFEVTGPSATTNALRMDRFWRNIRVHSLHDPLDYKVRELGEWTLNGTYPTPGFYS